jgi:flagellar basal body P-ring formation protein FlgA
MSRLLGLLVCLSWLPVGTLVELEAQQVDGGAPVAARDLPRGAVLADSDLEYAAGSAADLAPPIGWVTRRVVAKGEPLKPPTIARPEVIRSGDAVQVVWSGEGMEIRLNGRAMNSAQAGERVTVRVDTRRRFEGVALESGVVRLETLESGRSR